MKAVMKEGFRTGQLKSLIGPENKWSLITKSQELLDGIKKIQGLSASLIQLGLTSDGVSFSSKWDMPAEAAVMVSATPEAKWLPGQ